MNNLSIERVWEDTDFFEIEVKAQSELVCAKVKSYTTKSLINELALRLTTFPQNFNDRYIWKNGEKGDSTTPFVSLEFWCENKLGHIVIEVYMELNDGGSLSKHNCCFFIKTEIGLLNAFGEALNLLKDQGISKMAVLNQFI